MTAITRRKQILATVNRLSAILPAFFWLFLIFGFESINMAVITVLSALAHEAGHIACIFCFKKSKLKIKSVISGLRISSPVGLSYDEEIITYAAGPAINIFLWLLFTFLTPVIGYISQLIAIINLATAISNLMPIRGYDGYGIIRALLQKHSTSSRPIIVLSRISTVLVLLLCTLSLYLIDRKGGGYWVFVIFFVSVINHIKEGLGE